MTWLMSERNTWSLDAMLLSGMLGMAEWTAKASMRLGVATKLPKVAAASYPKERPEPIRYATVVATPSAAPTTIGALGWDNARRSMAGKHTASRRLRAFLTPSHLQVRERRLRRCTQTLAFGRGGGRGRWGLSSPPAWPAPPRGRVGGGRVG